MLALRLEKNVCSLVTRPQPPKHFPCYPQTRSAFHSSARAPLDLTALFSRDAHVISNETVPNLQSLLVIPNELQSSFLGEHLLRAKFGASHLMKSVSTHEIKQTDTKGMGLFSSTSLSAGDVALVETPVLFAALTRSRLGMVENLPAVLASLCRRHLDDVTLEALSELSRSSRSLARMHPGDGDSEAEEDFLERIFATNLIRTDVDNPVDGQTDSFAALPLKSSRCNHSCSPNALLNFESTSLAYALTASTTIRRDEELLLSYVDTTLPGSTRRAQLREKWAFECECPACSLPPSEAFASDARRAELREWFDVPENKSAASIPLRHPLPSTLSTLLRSTILPSVERYVALSDAEGYLNSDYLYSALERGAFSYALLGEKDEFLRWAGRARAQLRVLGTTPSSRRAQFTVEKWDGALADPQGSFLRWGECR